MILWFILVDVAIRLAQAMIATWYNYHDFSHFQHVIPFERVSFGFTTYYLLTLLLDLPSEFVGENLVHFI